MSHLSDRPVPARRSIRIRAWSAAALLACVVLWPETPRDGATSHAGLVPPPPPPVEPAQHNFPVQGPRPGAMQAVRAFPSLAFARPIFVTHAPDGSDRIFVVEQAGTIRVFPNDERITAARTFLDITARVSRASNEEGLLGLAFAPDYAQSGRFYLYYSSNTGQRRTVLSSFRVTANPDVGDPNSEVELLSIDQPFSNHNGGMLAFGPDGMLYIGVGDGGSGGDPFGNGQNKNTLLGKILRIDPSRPSGSLPYTIPSDNPFAGTAGARGEIWAFGMRNPWRLSFDRQTGELWCGDVGQNAREEIDVIVRGGNYGWNVYEGNLAYNNPGNLPPSLFKAPIRDYPTSEGRCVIGGYVYRGTRFAELRGAYLHGDYSSGRIWALVARNGQVVSNTLLASVGSVATFGEDQSGEVLIASLSGTLHKLQRSGGGSGNFPVKLSQTGLFADLATLAPAVGVVPFEVNAPLWSDGAEKRRWLAWPGVPFVFHPTDPWSFPVGTVTVKHFEIELVQGVPASTKRLETRVFVHEIDGWAGYTYRWDSTGTDADLVTSRASEPLTIRDRNQNIIRQQVWTYPSGSDCLLCHTQAEGRVLGVRTHQLNRTITSGSVTVNQLEAWNANLFFTTNIGSAAKYPAYPEYADTRVAPESRAKAYLHVHCAVCHQPNGTAPTDFDLRYATPTAQMGVVHVRPNHGELGLPDAYLVKAHMRESSVLWERMRRTSEVRMPPFGSVVPDPTGIDLVGEWIGTPFVSFGSGCAGAGGTPSLQMPPDGYPGLGRTFVTEALRMPPGVSAATFLAGTSRSRWGSANLPLDLGPYGMPGCSLYTSGELHLAAQVGGTTARLQAQVPNLASLLGTSMYLQAAVADASANPLGVVLSDAAVVTFVR
ncbi:MAG: PQQ-dependent sugar dehydrogenase [Planctomycetes bacterium]|nr:PQQ-dependent sugar dehydrogenase [Planctomycetota bacterium]